MGDGMRISRQLIVGVVCALAVCAPASLAQAQAPDLPGVPPAASHHGGTVTAPRATARGGLARQQAADQQGANPQDNGARGLRAVPLGTSPQTVVVDAQTGTAYVSSD